jgi:predicted nucleotidyltransferase
MDLQLRGQLESAQGDILRRLTDAFEADGRVLSCWLGGSLGRGEADAWSDIDLDVMVAPGDLAAFAQTAYEILQGLGPVLLSWPGDLNQSPRGLGAFYDNGVLVDLCIHDAERGPTYFSLPVHVVFGEPPAGVGAPPKPPPLGVPEREWPIRQRVFGFWLQVLFAAKYAARGDLIMGSGHVACARGTLVQLLDMSRAPVVWVPPLITHATWGRLTAEERVVLAATLGSVTAAGLDEQIAGLVQAADRLLTPLAVGAGCGDFAGRMESTVRTAIAARSGL